MVPRFFPAGKSFRKLAAYLLHDPDKARTDERVHWTHTLNLASDRPASAVDEMLWTVRGADWLKQQNGVRNGGRPLEKPVKHFSLSWHPSEAPTREQMIEAVASFLAHMGWQDHQALIVNHTDKQHPHVHVMLNAVNPETGRALDSSFEKRRAQEWALEHERKHGLIFCEERLKPIEQRTPSPTRATWETLRHSERQHDRAEVERVTKDPDYFERNDTDKTNSKEWRTLKALQRQEREEFFKEGKEAYRDVRNGVFREVRAEFRERWRDYYDAKRDGLDGSRLADMKEIILTDQRSALDERREAACLTLRLRRDGQYQILLMDQMDRREQLTHSQSEGHRPYGLLNAIYPPEKDTLKSPELGRGFRDAANEHCAKKKPDHAQEQRPSATNDRPLPKEHHKVRGGLDAVGGLGLGALGAIAAIGERLFDGFFGGGETPSGHADEPEPAHAHEEEPDEARKVAALQKTTESKSEDAARLQAYWEERRQRRRDRD
jgi:Relaxase/Mobilisation nuclease domain